MAAASLQLVRAVWLFVEVVILYRVCLVVYRLFFHPLSRFPGPKLNAISYLPFLYQDKIAGKFVKDVLKLHEKYGSIVRISPDRLAIDGSIGWSEVFARRPNQAEFGKTVEFYSLPKRIGLFPALREDHRRQRRLVSHAFSESALSEQEMHIKRYVDLLMTRLEERMEVGDPVDMTRWYNFLTFDIIGELAFGDPFYSLENSDYHPWIAMIFSGIRAQSRAQFFNHYSLLRPVLYFMLGKDDIEKRDQSIELARAKTEKRIALGTDTRKDFLTYILRNNTKENGMSHEEIIINARAFISAGSETTATALAGLTFHLTQNQGVCNILTREIRTAFASEDEINMRSTAALQFLHACLEETLRIYPPVGETPPRVSPGDVVDGQYIPEGTYVTIYQWASHHSSRNFIDPDLFVPQRWLTPTHPLYDGRYASDNRKAFKPFSAGPRDCIGKNLAYAEMRIVVARLLWKFDIELLEGQQDWVDRQRSFVVYEKGPLMVKLKPREWLSLSEN